MKEMVFAPVPEVRNWKVFPFLTNSLHKYVNLLSSSDSQAAGRHSGVL